MNKAILILLFTLPSLSQTIPQNFFEALIYDKAEITDYVNKDELAKSKRLSITYTGIKNKFLIGNELPDEFKDGVRSGKYKYELSDKPLEDGFVEVTFNIPDANFTKIYYFNDGFVTASTYKARNWTKQESKYFNFRIQEPIYFNDYCVERLDEFVDMVADTLGFTISEKRILEKEKINYIFCTDENEVEKLTGYKAKGMAMLGSDEVITFYQTHFHEVAHILINFKLKTLGLYTLPFFMEGFAVAMGGRGGMAPRVVTDIGYYLQKTHELTYDSIFTFDQFRSMDGSMSYPVAGLYNSFLLSELGGEKYLELYKKVNGNLEYVKGISSSQINFPEIVKFDQYLTKYNDDKLMYIDEMDTIKLRVKIFGSSGEFILSKDYIKIFSHDIYSIGFDEVKTDKEYISRKYSELYNTDYKYMKYCILASNESINIYNLFNDELIFSYNIGLSLNTVIIPKKDGFFEFFVKTSLFGSDFDSEKIIMDGTFR